MNKGMVYLIGAGPGDPGLITLKAVECIGRADVVVYDFLANPVFLSYASPGVELLYVGKKGSEHTRTQDEINRLIAGLALGGRTVARLKGGDPFVFGRGGEEAEDLAAAGIPFEVIPGVTSAIAAAAYAGIPVTHRGFTSNVGFLTGHEDPTKPESGLDWDKIATGFGTLVFLMGVKNLESITANLIRGGRAPETPAALIRWGTTPEQETLTATLADIAARARERGMTAPAVLVVGEVVGLRERLNWFERLPLFGRQIMVTRTRTQASRLTRKLARLGAGVIECPTIRIVPPEDWSTADQAIGSMAEYDWLILTSPNGVEALWKRMRDLGRDARLLAGVKIAAIGPATAEKLLEIGLAADLMPDEYVAEGLAEALIRTGLQERRVLIARAAQARDVLPESLSAAGALVREAAVYRTVAPDGLTPEAESALARGSLDLVTCTSSSTVTNLVQLLGERFSDFKNRVQAACIGPITARTAREAGLRVAVQAGEYTVDGLVEAIVEHFRHEA